jgi:hypothetical protein
VNFGRSAPARQLVPELPEHDLPVTPGSAETPQASGLSQSHTCDVSGNTVDRWAALLTERC